MPERTLQEALKRAEALREFRKVNSLAFERNEDQQDVVSLADEVQRLMTLAVAVGDPIHFINSYGIPDREEDHDESW